jgi:uncharacterized protein YcbK (DUF882 family)
MIFKFLQYFSINEKWGDPDKMDRELLVLLDKLRAFVGAPMSIHEGYATSGHSATSQHYSGKAVDFHIVNLDPIEAYDRIKTFLELYDLANKVGLGFYPTWNNPGFHLDVRGTKARWSFINSTESSIETGLFYYKERR